MGAIDEEVAHDLRRERQKVSSIRKIHTRCVDEPEIRFVNEPARVQGISRRGSQPLVRQLPQPLVDERYELIPGADVSFRPASQEAGDIGNPI